MTRKVSGSAPVEHCPLIRPASLAGSKYPAMVTKITNPYLNFVDPPIDDMVLLEGTLDDVVIGEHVPNEATFTELTDTSLASPLIGATTGLLSEVFLGTGLAMAGNVLYVVFSPSSSPSSASRISGQAISALGRLGS